MQRFRDFLLSEAYDSDKTWETNKAALIKRASTPIAYKSKGGVDIPPELAAHKKAAGIWSETDQNSEHFHNPVYDNTSIAHNLRKLGAYESGSYMGATGQDAKGLLLAHSNFAGINQTTGEIDYGHAGFAGREQQFKDHIRGTVMRQVETVENKKYAPKILDMYAKGGIKRAEDMGTSAVEAFNKYDELAKASRLKGDHTNWKAFKTIKDVAEVVNHPDYAGFWQENRSRRIRNLPGDSYTTVRDNDQVTIYHPHTHEAAVALAHCPHTGQKATWCFAADSDEGKKWFNEYDHESPILIYHPKEPEHDGEMYATHEYSGQRMDEYDEPVKYSESTHGRQEARQNYPRLGWGKGHGLVDSNTLGPRFPSFTDASSKYYSFEHMIKNPEHYDPDTMRNHGPFYYHMLDEAEKTKPLGEDHPERKAWRKAWEHAGFDT